MPQSPCQARGPHIPRIHSRKVASGRFCRHCRTSGICARLRTIGEAGTQVSILVHTCANFGRFCRKALSAYECETQKGPRGRNPSRARLVACAPIRNFFPALAVPKARFCRSPARYSPFINRMSAYPIDPGALEPRFNPAAGVLGPAPACGCLRALLLISRRAALVLPIPSERRNEPARRATSIVARPGMSCKCATT
jgi:hypothetical protein